MEPSVMRRIVGGALILFLVLTLQVAWRLSRVLDLNKAARLGDVATVRRMLDEGMPVDTPVHSITPLIAAARFGRCDVAALLLSRGASVRAVDEQGSTALLKAIESGHPEMVALLLKHDANPNDPEHECALALARHTLTGGSVPHDRAQQTVDILLRAGARDRRQIPAEHPMATTPARPAAR